MSATIDRSPLKRTTAIQRQPRDEVVREAAEHICTAAYKLYWTSAQEKVDVCGKHTRKLPPGANPQLVALWAANAALRQIARTRPAPRRRGGRRRRIGRWCRFG